MSRTRSISELVTRARDLAGHGSRRILGITGPPGAGKTTLATAIIAGLGELAVAVPMDGFHLTNAELERLGRRDRKGAPDTFDVEGTSSFCVTSQREIARYSTHPRFLARPMSHYPTA